MPLLKLTVLSLRYSSWSMRPWLALTHAGATFETETVRLPHMLGESGSTPLADRRSLGSARGLFPVLRIDGIPVHESLAICEFAADTFPETRLWPEDAPSRAQARAISCEMLSGFTNMRNQLACHLFARVPDFIPSADTLTDISRIFELWKECLDRSGGPFLFGRFGIADAMYYPVLTRFRTYGIPLADTVADYAHALEALPAVQQLNVVASSAPPTPIYDDYIRELGGNPDAELPVT